MTPAATHAESGAPFLVSVNGEAPIAWSAFYRTNAEGLDAEDLARIYADLVRDGTSRVGGGAEAESTITAVRPAAQGLFSPLAALPGWEATEGTFRLCGCGKLRFLRYVRRTGDRLAYAIVTATPVEFDRFVERSAAAFALVGRGSAAEVAQAGRA